MEFLQNLYSQELNCSSQSKKVIEGLGKCLTDMITLQKLLKKNESRKKPDNKKRVIKKKNVAKQSNKKKNVLDEKQEYNPPEELMIPQ